MKAFDNVKKPQNTVIVEKDHYTNREIMPAIIFHSLSHQFAILHVLGNSGQKRNKRNTAVDAEEHVIYTEMPQQ